MISFPGAEGIIITSAIIDPVTNELVVTLDYSQDIQGTDLNLEITPP